MTYENPLLHSTMTKSVGVFRYVGNFVQRFWFLAFWIAITGAIYWKTYRNFKTQPQYYYLRTILGWWLCVSRGTAPVIILCSLVVLLAVCRSLHTLIHATIANISSRLLAAWLSKVKTMHMVCASTLIIFSIYMLFTVRRTKNPSNSRDVIHTGAHIMNAVHFSKHYTSLYPDINLAKFKGENPALLICTWTGYSGIAMLILLLAMSMTSTSKFRSKHFNTFYVTHHLFLIYLLLLLTHPISGILKEQRNVNQHLPGCIVRENNTIEEEEGFPEPTEGHPGFFRHKPQFKCIPTQSWIWISIALIIYIIELGYRRYRGSCMEAIQACQLPKNIVHLRFKSPSNFCVDPGQYILLQCDQISRIEWHPFTVTKCPTPNQQSFEVLISVRGDWTKLLYSNIKSPFSFNECNSYISRLYHKPLKFSIDGPFVSPMQSIKYSKYAICVAAGIGITAYVASLRFILANKTETPKRLHLLWLTRDPKQLMWYAKLLCDLHNKFWDENQPDRFQIQLYVTKDYKKREVDHLFKNSILRNRINIGRPDWKEEFRIWNFMYKRNKISFFCCGPKNLTQDLRSRCLAANKKGNSFTFIHEGF